MPRGPMQSKRLTMLGVVCDLCCLSWRGTLVLDQMVKA